MIRSTLLAAAGTLLIASPAAAASYFARPATPLAAQRLIGRDIVWACGPDACQGATDDSRPLVLCQGLARRTGRIAAFTVDGRALAAAELDRCNQVAAPSPTQARPPAAQ